MQTRGGVLSELLVEHVEPGHVQRIQSTQHHRFYCRLALYWRAMRCEPLKMLLRASAGRCRFFNALHVRGKCRALLVFFLRTLGGDARRWLRWILNPSRRSFELSVL